ncbi:MAG: nucleotidyltransferase family protein [Spirochaetota bacterium]|nr:nucleotidyltransferase family protein [Spirochaetota bacterium]
MKAMIFAAGLGTRLRPLTNDKPKALAEINGIPILEILIERLKRFGFDDIIINVHHFADRIAAFLMKKNNFNIKITISDETEMLLDTGGGLKKARSLLDKKESFLLHNVDILSNIDLEHLYNTHNKSDALVTLAVCNKVSDRSLLFDDNNILCGWKNSLTNQLKISRESDILKPLSFAGIHVINPRIFGLIKEEGVFSIIDLYLELAKRELIRAYNIDTAVWMDVGDMDSLKKAVLIVDKIS